MSSIITPLLKVAVGFLVDKAVEELRGGDVVDQTIRQIITGDIKKVKLRLDALSRKDLLTAIDAFELGVKYLYKAMDLESDAATKDAVDAIVRRPNMPLMVLGGDATFTLSEGKRKFEIARDKAAEACNTGSLSTLEHITAVRYRVMATILDSAVRILGQPASQLSSSSMKSALKDALIECETCLQNLHIRQDVKSNFKSELKKGVLDAIWAPFKGKERKEIIVAVWRMNRAINNVRQHTGNALDICTYPTIDVENEKIDPLRDGRVMRVLQTLDIDYGGILWSFGEDGEDDHKLRNAKGIAINAGEEFILVDDDKSVKVFDNSGLFIYNFDPHVQTDDARAKLLDVATDENNNNYVLVLFGGDKLEVQVFNRTELNMKFYVLGEGYFSKLRVGKGNVLVLAVNVVHVYDLNGRYKRSFGKGILRCAEDAAVGPSGQMFVLDSRQEVCIVFDEDGVEKHKFAVCRERTKLLRGLDIHPQGEYVFVVKIDWLLWLDFTLTVEMYTKDGVFHKETMLREKKSILSPLPSVAISKEGRLAATCRIEGVGGMVIVL
ncbi:uncharacterized protein [Montipora capricornis]|uniref:uncharacterized protein n=1 Tax=Montipora capricornis TaxID=246305 RepID=UPI0035F12B86